MVLAKITVYIRLFSAWNKLSKYRHRHLPLKNPYRLTNSKLLSIKSSDVMFSKIVNLTLSVITLWNCSKIKCVSLILLSFLKINVFSAQKYTEPPYHHYIFFFNVCMCVYMCDSACMCLKFNFSYLLWFYFNGWDNNSSCWCPVLAFC